MKTPAPHFSYPKREGYFADTKRLGRAPEAPMAVDVPTLDAVHYTDEAVLSRARIVGEAFDWTETQGDLAPVVRKVERGLFIAALVMAGWFAGCLMALYVMNGVW